MINPNHVILGREGRLSAGPVLPEVSAWVRLRHLVQELQPAGLVRALTHMVAHPLAVERIRIARTVAVRLLWKMRARLRRKRIPALGAIRFHLPFDIQVNRRHPTDPMRHVSERGVRARGQHVAEAQQPHLHKRRLRLPHGPVLTPLPTHTKSLEM